MIDVLDAAIDTSLASAHAGVQQAAGMHTPESDSEDARWHQWKQKSRADDARFRQILKTILIDVGGAAALGGALWFAFVTWR